MALSTSGGAEAVKAATGAVVNALNPPSLVKDVRKSLPLQWIHIARTIPLLNNNRSVTNHSDMQCASSMATSDKFFLNKGVTKNISPWGDNSRLWCHEDCSRKGK